MTVVRIRPMVAADVLAINRQPSQIVQLGLERAPTIQEGEALASEGEAWTAIDGDRVVACLGIRETYPGRQGVAWAILSPALGAAHLTITRHARARIADSPLVRVEAIVRSDAEIMWAKIVGLTPVCVLRKFGAASEDHVLCERVR